MLENFIQIKVISKKVQARGNFRYQCAIFGPTSHQTKEEHLRLEQNIHKSIVMSIPSALRIRTLAKPGTKVRSTFR